MDVTLYVIAAVLIAVGAIGALIPAMPGIPLLFGGIWLLAWVDHYRHLGWWWLLGIAAIGSSGLIVDLLAAALGAKRVAASPQAVWGALVGTLFGVFFGLPGLLLGPFLGAVLGEFAAGNSVLRSAHVGVGTWLGLLFGTLVKMICALTMMALAATGWWWNRGA